MAKIMLFAAMAGIAGCASTMSVPTRADLIGGWAVEYIGERPVIDNSPAYMEFNEEGRVAGNSSCNQFTGTYVMSGDSLVFSKLASTKKMCPPALMEQETSFLTALEGVAKVRFEKGLLMLLDSNDKMLVKASRRPK
jgi:heat shock protein HslJ